jgi:predicted DsbA family dithiol-disulfide isomerase
MAKTVAKTALAKTLPAGNPRARPDGQGAAKTTLKVGAARPTGPTSKTWSNPCIPPQIAKGKATIRLHHAMAPTCWWSWGYYGTLARVRLVYGDQVDLRIVNTAVYDDLDHWCTHNGMTPASMQEWAKESQGKMGVPIFTGYAKAKLPKDTTPAAFAVIAALRQGRPLGERFERALLRRSSVEGIDVTVPAVIDAAAKEAGLDLARLRKDLADRKGLEAEMAAQNEGAPNVPLGFYNVALEDDKGRTIVLDYAFDPDEVVGAIEYLSGGTLRKNTPDDPVAYLQATGPAPARELARAFAWTPAATEERLRKLATAGQVKQVAVGGAPHWTVA